MENKNNNSSLKNPWRKWIEPWYLSYALQGITIAGLLPILLPLAVSKNGNAAHIGLVMAAFSLGGLTAPLWGSLADKLRLHRWLLTSGMILTTGAVIAFIYVSKAGYWVLLSFLMGLGAACSATVANLFIVEVHPKKEWDERIGWLQTFYGIGQVIGLLLAGLLSLQEMRLALYISAAYALFAGIIGITTTRTPGTPLAEKPILRHPIRHIESIISSPQRLFHYLNPATLKKIGPALNSPFGLFLLVWVLALGGSAAFFAQYPVLMKTLFGVSSGLSSTIFAVAAGLGLILYSPAGLWSDRIGPVRVTRISQGVRLLAYVILLIAGFINFVSKDVIALIAFVVVVCSWSLISVSGTTLAAKLSPVGEGEGLGFFNAANAIAGVLGAVIGGWIANSFGYSTIAIIAVVGILGGILLSFRLPGNSNS